MLKSLIWGNSDPILQGGAGSSIFDGELQDGKPPDDNGPFPEVLPSRVRAAYHLHPGGRRKGPLSVNDPELPQTPANRRSVFDSFYEIPSPFGHYDARSQWRIHYRDHIAHVHRLLRILMAAQDFAGAARCLAVLHRLHATFDPNVYRYTVNLLRLHGDHSKMAMYFRKVLGTRNRQIRESSSLQARAIAIDFVEYLLNTRRYDEALSVVQGISEGGRHSGKLKRDPSFKAHAAVLRLFMAMLENSANASARGDDDSQELSPLLVSDLQDPLALIEPLRSCWATCAKEGIDKDAQRAVRVLDHLREAENMITQATQGMPSDASVAGFRAAMEAAKNGLGSGLQQLEAFIGHNPGSVKAHALYARLVETFLKQCQARACPGNRSSSGAPNGLEDAEQGQTACASSGTHLVEVMYVRALRRWLEADRLEPRAVLGLASRLAQRSGAIIGIADVGFISQALIAQVETWCTPRTCPAGIVSGACSPPIHTTRAAVALWRALADLLGPLRVRDAPVPLPRGGLRRAGGAPPIPGTIYDRLYGGDPPWGPMDFQRTGGVIESTRSRGWAVEGAGDGLPRPPAPHPRLRSVDRELWGEVLLDSNADPLLVVKRDGGADDTEEMWCSDDEDCVVDDDVDALEERAWLSSKRTGGCLYYLPPAEVELESWGGELANSSMQGDSASIEDIIGQAGAVTTSEDETTQDLQRDKEGHQNRTKTGGEDKISMEVESLDRLKVMIDNIVATRSRRRFDKVDNEEDVIIPDKEESVLSATEAIGPGSSVGSSIARSAQEDKHRDDVDSYRDSSTGTGRGKAQSEGKRQAGKRSREDQGVEEDDEEGEEITVLTRSKRANMASEVVILGEGKGEGDTESKGAGESSSQHSEKRRKSFFAVNIHDDVMMDRDEKIKPVHDDRASNVEEEAEHHVGASRDRAKNVDPVSWLPMGMDEETTRLSEMIYVETISKEAASLLADKCCVAGHLFGPAHPYCLRAIARLCRDDIRELARPARKLLRRRGFRLQLSLARQDAAKVRAAAARNAQRSVAWGFQSQSASTLRQPLDSYVPEPIRR